MASKNFPVAIIGMSCRLPEAENLSEFWNFLLRKGDSVHLFPKERAKNLEHVLSAFNESYFVDPKNPYFSGSFFRSIEMFDNEFFGISSSEAEFIDPQQRFFLENAWHAIEDAGEAQHFYGSNTGVYVGNTMDRYRLVLTENNSSISHGNHPPFIASRLSYIFNLSGPAMMVSTGCSSSLLSVHVACQGLASGDCKMAIAGGITLDVLPISSKIDIWNQLGITNLNTKCRPFDADSNGIAKGEGCGVVILKSLKDALKDGNSIYGVINGSVANHDGHSNGITAPNPCSQTKMLLAVWEKAEINPNDLGFIEAHGTGTHIGDPIEAYGIKSAFEEFSKKTKLEKSNFSKIPIGSVKGNIGHTADGSAGILGLIKAVLCIKNKIITGSANFIKPNPLINWESMPICVNKEKLEWILNESKNQRIAGVSSFGLVGTNVHIIVSDWSMNTEEKELR